MLGRYTVESERQAFADYLQGNPPPQDLNAAWHDTLDKARNDQQTMTRVRVIDTVTPYIKFEVECGYEKNIEHGEDIWFLISSDFTELAQVVPVLKDYWLFDDENCFLVEYDYYGRFLGVVQVPSAIVPQYVKLSRLLKEKANMSFEEVMQLVKGAKVH